MESLLNRLTTEGSELSRYNGETPPVSNTDVPDSKLHDEYSINGTPGLPGFPTPSELDLNGVTPPKYTDNLPG
jgi:hypothetical protein|tara:strand:- start:2937 stop:3155 length:219 start_codon:yes stop_codon:yes gene_type:complete